MREKIIEFINSLSGVDDDLSSKAVVELVVCGTECPNCCKEQMPKSIARTCDALVDIYSDGKGGSAISLLFPLYMLQDNFDMFNCVCCDFSDAALRHALYGTKQTLNLCLVLRPKSNMMQKLIVNVDAVVVSNQMSKTIILFCQEENFALVNVK